MVMAFIAFALLVLYVGIVLRCAQRGCVDDERRAFSSSADRSLLGSLLYCGICPMATSCHKYIEDERAKHGKVEIFCPQSPFMLRLTGRQNR